MAKILMFGNQKGGVGKSQVSIMTATALSSPPFNLKVAVLDVDGQKSVVRIREVDQQSYPVDTVLPFTVLNLKVSVLQQQIGVLDKEFEVLIIDAAGKLDVDAPIETQEITKSLMYVDFLFMPFVAGNHNLTATFDYFRFVRQVQQTRQIQPRALHVFGFVNMFRSRSRVNTFLMQDIEDLKTSEGLVMLQTALNDYALFKEADTITSIYNNDSNDSAKANFSTFINELLHVIQK
jgi:cellulose biosynthesis protein BcsQ